jgi:hypothetical protein
VSALIAALLLAGCDGGDDTSWARFNADDTVQVEVTASEDLGEAVSADLHSTTGARVVGSVVVDPGSGPVGTDHEVTVEVLDEWEDEVGRVTVRTDAGERGVEDHELWRDSADHGLWVRTLTSVGVEGEERTDTFSVRLWVEDENGDTGQ